MFEISEEERRRKKISPGTWGECKEYLEEEWEEWQGNGFSDTDYRMRVVGPATGGEGRVYVVFSGEKWPGGVKPQEVKAGQKPKEVEWKRYVFGGRPTKRLGNPETRTVPSEDKRLVIR